MSLSQCLRSVHLTADKISEVDYVHTLCLARSNQVSIEGFSDEEVNYMINIFLLYGLTKLCALYTILCKKLIK